MALYHPCIQQQSVFIMMVSFLTHSPHQTLNKAHQFVTALFSLVTAWGLWGVDEALIVEGVRGQD